VHMRFQRALRLRTWDGFQLPWPGSEVEIEFAEPYTVPRDMTEEECEHQRAKLERVMVEGTGEIGGGKTAY
jgi:lysophospholipid acyltransferase (LPLAT)-like uncharacterized protein